VCVCIVYRRISSTGHSQVQTLEWDGDVGVCVYRCVCVYMDVRTCVDVWVCIVYTCDSQQGIVRCKGWSGMASWVCVYIVCV